MVNLGRRMNKLAALILSIAALVGVIGPAPAGPTPVTWSFHQTTICDFNGSWSEVAGVLTSISINIDAVNDNIGGLAGPPGFHLIGGAIASDGTLGGCGFTQCQIAGFWQSDVPVAEPASAALLASGLFGAWLGRRRRTGRGRTGKTRAKPPPTSAPSLGERQSRRRFGGPP